MADSTVIAKYRAIDTIIERFAAQVDSYIDSMNASLTRLRRHIGELESGLRGEDFDSFSASLEENMRSIEEALRRAKKLSDDLHLASSRFHEILRKLEGIR